MRVGSILLIAVVGLAATVGCQGPDLVKAPNTAAPDPLSAQAYPDIVLVDGLERSLVKEQPYIQPPGGDDTLLVRVPLRSIVDSPVRIRWQIVFSTDTGEQLTDNPVWHEEVILPRTRKFIEARALTRRATKWNLTVRVG